MPELSDKKLYMGKAAVNMIYSVLNEKPLSDLPEDFDWQGFKSFTQEHNISNIIRFALKDMNNVPEDIYGYYEETYLRLCVKEAVYDVEIPALLDEFEKCGVRHMPLKGYIIKNYYPDMTMRSMGDVDILVGSDIQKAHEVMANMGYSLHGEGFLHDNFFKATGVNVELHKSLVDEYFKEMYDYYREGFDNAEIKSGYKYRYEFSNEDFYIFLTAHLAKHFKMSGTGIRSIIDFYIYRRHFQNLDNDYIDSELSKMGLLKFKEKIEQLAFDWFSKPFDGEFDAVGEYIILSGVYGQSDSHELNAFILNTFSSDSYSKGKFKYFISMIFPGKKYLGARYPVVNKCPLLIPLFWVVRGFSSLFSGRGNIRYRLKGVAESDETALKKFDDTGLR